jgi:hypothetical protein
MEGHLHQLSLSSGSGGAGDSKLDIEVKAPFPRQDILLVASAQVHPAAAGFSLTLRGAAVQVAQVVFDTLFEERPRDSLLNALYRFNVGVNSFDGQSFVCLRTLRSSHE